MVYNHYNPINDNYSFLSILWRLWEEKLQAFFRFLGSQGSMYLAWQFLKRQIVIVPVFFKPVMLCAFVQSLLKNLMS